VLFIIALISLPLGLICWTWLPVTLILESTFEYGWPVMIISFGPAGMYWYNSDLVFHKTPEGKDKDKRRNKRGGALHENRALNSYMNKNLNSMKKKR
jgi:hypothetical protein